MNENATHTGVFHVFDNPGYSTDELRALFAELGLDGFMRHLPGYERRQNLLMSAQKLAMANAVYPTIDSLVLTSQTSIPVDSETSYSGTIYTANISQEFTRSGNVNPYILGWNITSESANGPWGSFITLNSNGVMINRALAGVTKKSGATKLVMFTGTVSG